VGIDYYPRHALAAAGPVSVYLDGSRTRWQQRHQDRLLDWAAETGTRLMISEGQAEPWEAVTTPPSPTGRAMYSCRPEDVVSTYSQALRWCNLRGFPLDAYLFWGAEYWLLRERQGDPRYLRAFARVLDFA
jgi:hypothetical protein